MLLRREPLQTQPSPPTDALKLLHGLYGLMSTNYMLLEDDFRFTAVRCTLWLPSFVVSLQDRTVRLNRELRELKSQFRGFGVRI